MRRATLALLCLVLLTSQMPHQVVGSEFSEADNPRSNGVIEHTINAHGTDYHLSINTSNHTVQVSAIHLENNRTAAGYSVHLNRNRVIDESWEATKGDTSHSKAFLMYEYDAKKKAREIMFSTYNKKKNVSYNFTVPRKYEGRYLRPTVTDVEIERVNRTWGRLTVTVRSDARYYYGAYVLIWTPEADRKKLYMHRTKGENMTRESVLVRVPTGEPFEGEIRLHPRWVNGSGPLHTQYEFYGRPGEASLQEVAYEPLGLNEIGEYSYENESHRGSGFVEGIVDGRFRTVLAVLAGVSMLVILGAVMLAQRRRS